MKTTSHRHHTHRALTGWVCALALVGAALWPGQVQAASQSIYDDALAGGWDNYSWATVDLEATSPVHSGSHSIAVTYSSGWQGLYLFYPGRDTSPYTHLRFFIHGGSAGGQSLQIYVNHVIGGTEESGPKITVTPPTAGVWSEVRIPLTDLDAADTLISGIVWQDTTGHAQPTFYIDDLALVRDEDPAGPTLSEGQVLPAAAPADGSTVVVVKAHVADPQGLGDVAGVTLDAGALGRGDVALHDDGRSNDSAANDGLYGAAFTVAPGTPSGEYALNVSAQDAAGHIAILPLGAFVVLAPPGGSQPAALPQRLGYGTDEWSGTPGQDWQVNSGVPWDYVYQYITYGWEGWGENFVGRFVTQAWSKSYIPVISVYMMLELPPQCGEGGICYAQKLKQNASAVHDYLAKLAEAVRQAQGTKPVIFQLEPDFYGFMQQFSNSDGRPAGVQPDDPSSFPVALNLAGYPNNLAGFGRRMVDVVHEGASNALVAPHASMWATGHDPAQVLSAEVPQMAQRTATFLNQMGGAQADLFTVEWSDRDAGSGLRPWWDDTNRELPRPARAVLWENALSVTAGKRLFLWQVPCGNMSLDNTPQHYRDNRVAYIYRHPRDLVDTGVTAVLFGGGRDDMTAPSTDGGLIAAQGTIAYGLPAAPTDLATDPPVGAKVPFHWNENTEPDLWGYRLRYEPAAGAPPTVATFGRANAATLLLPSVGSWRVRVMAYHAMGQSGPASAPVTVTTTESARLVWLPFTEKR